MSNSAPSGPSSPALARLAYVLDDEAQVRAIVGKILFQVGYTPRQFATPAALFAEMKVATPELIVLDLALGQSDAIEVIRNLETFGFKSKVLLISGRDLSTLAEIQRIGERRGLTMLPPIQKPFRVADVRASLAAANTQEGAAGEAPPSESCEPSEVRIDPAEALRNSWLRLWYQPKVELKSMTVCGAEALLRARHPDYGIIAPSNFLPAGRASVYQPITKFVVMQAMADWENFAAQGQPLRISINVPLSALQSPAFVDLVRAALPHKPNFPGMIVEVAEGDILTDPSGAREIATQLKLYNVLLSIDNFGGARTSLALLRDLPCVEIKLDPSYVQGAASDMAKQSVCAAAIELAHGFGLTVCAKSVENMDDLRTMVELGCHTAQGFLFAKPVDSLNFLRLLRRPPPQGARLDNPADLKLRA